MGWFDYRAWPSPALIRGPHDLARELIHVLLHFLVLLSRRRPGKTRMNSVHASVAIEKNRGGIGAEVDHLREGFFDLPLVSCAGQQQRKAQCVFVAVDADLPQVTRGVIDVLVSETHNH